MGTLFNFDGKFMQTIKKITDSLYLSILWFLFSLPIITIGASTTALYYTVNKTVRHERGYIFTTFWDSFKTSFIQATISWIVLIICYLIAGIDILFLHIRMPLFEKATYNYIIYGLLLGMIAMWQLYVFPYIARFEDTTKTCLKNALRMMVANFGNSLKLLVVFVISAILFVVFPPLIAVIPVLYSFVSHTVIERVFRKYISPEELALEEERNRTYDDEYNNERMKN